MFFEDFYFTGDLHIGLGGEAESTISAWWLSKRLQGTPLTAVLIV